MSRTKRKNPKVYFRDIKTKNVKTAEHYAVQELEEEGFHASNRHAARGNPTSRAIPDAWDDIKSSAWFETYRPRK